MRFQPRACAEFPNDNPDLHLGAVWVCGWTRAHPSAEAAQTPAPEEPHIPEQPSAAPAPVRSAPQLARPFDIQRVPSAPEQLSLIREQASAGSELATNTADSLSKQEPAGRPVPQRAARLSPAAPSTSSAPPAKATPSTGSAPSAKATPSTGSAPPAEVTPSTDSAPPIVPEAPAPRAVLEAEQRLDELFGDSGEQLLLDLSSPRDDSNPATLEQRAAHSPETVRSHTAALEAGHDFGVGSDDDIDSWQSQFSLRAQDQVVAALDLPFAEFDESAASTPSSFAADEADGHEARASLAICQGTATGTEVENAPAESHGEPLEPLLPFDLDGSLLDEEAPTVKPRGVDASGPTNALDPLELDLTLPQQDTVWEELEASLIRYFLHHDATRAAALLPNLLRGRKVRLDRLPNATQQCLLADGIATEGTDGLASSPDFQKRAQRMRRALSEGRMDAPTLTRWLADVTRSLLGTSTTPDGLLDSWRACGLTDVIERAA